MASDDDIQRNFAILRYALTEQGYEHWFHLEGDKTDKEGRSCLERSGDGRWKVYSVEKGEVLDDSIHESFFDACAYLYWIVTEPEGPYEVLKEYPDHGLGDRAEDDMEVLKFALDKKGFKFGKHYFIGKLEDSEKCDNFMCLGQATDGRWHQFWMERGRGHGISVFESEIDAAYNFYWLHCAESYLKLYRVAWEESEKARKKVGFLRRWLGMK